MEGSKSRKFEGWMPEGRAYPLSEGMTASNLRVCQ
jgi:hypothetical protein